MRIHSLTVRNYKSLRNITWKPGPLTLVIGANASGKSNLADFHDFLADTYLHGLSVAVARKGGYENIAHRKMRRSRGAITVEILAEIAKEDRDRRGSTYRRLPEDMPDLRVGHSYSFRAVGQAIKSDFRIENETITVAERTATGWDNIVDIHRTPQGIKQKGRIPKILSGNKRSNNRSREDLLVRQFRFLRDLNSFVDVDTLPSTELLIGIIGRFVPILRMVSQSIGSIRVFQFSPTDTRGFGVPIPNPEMDVHGGNLPAVVDMIIEHHPKKWRQIINIMRELLPGLERIEVDFTHSRTLGLFFHEKGVGRPWNVAEISDGTIHSLAILVALFDPRSEMLVLEEPENSVHTWILRALMDAATEASETKQIILTTHSRLVIDMVKPNDVWVMWRSSGESNLVQLAELDEELIGLIAEGDLTTFELLDSGIISQALPPGPKD